MSRNFELLQQASREDLLTSSDFANPVKAVSSARALPTTPASEEIAKLVQRLFFRGGQPSGPRVVSFSGVTRDDRSTWICAHAAESLATQTDTSVCVVDANFWSPQLHTQFALGNHRGLADALVTGGPIRSFATPLSEARAWLLPAGFTNANLCTHVERFRERLLELRQEFNYVLISAPSLVRETEATLIGQLSDGIVLIVEANRTRRESARQAKEHMEAARVRILGAVLDQRTFPIPESLYEKL